MKTFTLQEACNALAIDTTTLYRWMKRARMEAETDEADERRRTLTQVQVQQLARAHHRALPRSVKSEGLDQDAMQQHIDALEQRVEDLERKLEALESHAQPVKVLRPARATYEPEPVQPQETHAGVPPGAIKMRTFAEKHAPLTRDWLMPLIESKDIPSTDIPYGSRHQYWFLPEHLPIIVEYIRSHHIPFGQCDDPTCPCHTVLHT